MQELKVLAVSIYGTNLAWKILPECATIRRTARKCHNQKNIKKVQQSNEFPGRVTIKSSTRECRNYGYCQAVLQKVHPGSATIKSTQRKCRNQTFCQGVSQFRYLRKCHNQNYYQGPPQSKILPWTAAVMTGSAAMKHIHSLNIFYCILVQRGWATSSINIR